MSWQISLEEEVVSGGKAVVLANMKTILKDYGSGRSVSKVILPVVGCLALVLVSQIWTSDTFLLQTAGVSSSLVKGAASTATATGGTATTTTLVSSSVEADDALDWNNTLQLLQQHKDRPLPCQLKKYPTPIILMSLGRSGTASMYQVLAKLSGDGSSPYFIEYTGGNTAKSETFFRKTVPKEDIYGDWLVKFVCRQQRQHKHTGLVGFKWKPFMPTLTDEKALQGLALLSRLKNHNVPIKVIRSRRNLLDVQISRYKHNHGSKTEAHCQQDDFECIKKHLEVGSGIHLPVNDGRLLKELTKLDAMENAVDDLLDRMGVPAIRVSFEKLFSSSDVSEWTMLFGELGIGPSNLTRSDVDRAGHAATSLPYHNITLGNYAEVKMALNGTKFASLLH